MQKALFIKLCLIMGLIITLMIPVGLIEDVVRDRMNYRHQARADIERSWTGPQRVIGPLLVLPYQEDLQQEVWDAVLGQNRSVSKRQKHLLLVLPETLHINGVIQSEERKRGLYKIPVYTSELKVNGHFSNRQARQVIQNSSGKISWEKPYVTVLISDLRGVIKQPRFNWQEQQYAFESGGQLNTTEPGMHAELPALDHHQEGEFKFSFDFVLRGMETLSFAPLGKDTQLQLSSSWPHPSFTGRYLPSDYSVSDEGFQAQWLASSFSSGIADMAKHCADGNCDLLTNNTFGVSLLKTVDIYQQSERSLKYGILFLTLTFAFFFLYEILKRLAVHPVQYLLVGLALSVFYLLLVSLSEHMAFSMAYLVAAGACSGLLGTYVGAILGSRHSGGLFFIAMAGLYGVLYVILQSEDNALLMGSLLLFGILASAMMATRKVDWYSVRTGPTEKPQTIDPPLTD